MPGILSDIRVLELTHQPSGSFCAKMLADQGADAIKIEPPGWGDQARHEPPVHRRRAPPRPFDVFPGLQHQQAGDHPGRGADSWAGTFPPAGCDGRRRNRELSARKAGRIGTWVRQPVPGQRRYGAGLHILLRTDRTIRGVPEGTTWWRRRWEATCTRSPGPPASRPWAQLSNRWKSLRHGTGPSASWRPYSRGISLVLALTSTFPPWKPRFPRPPG